MRPPAVDLKGLKTELSFSPKYGEHTDEILKESGYSQQEIEQFKEKM